MLCSPWTLSTMSISIHDLCNIFSGNRNKSLQIHLLQKQIRKFYAIAAKMKKQSPRRPRHTQKSSTIIHLSAWTDRWWTDGQHYNNTPNRHIQFLKNNFQLLSLSSPADSQLIDLDVLNCINASAGKLGFMMISVFIQHTLHLLRASQKVQCIIMVEVFYTLDKMMPGKQQSIVDGDGAGKRNISGYWLLDWLTE